MRASKEELLDAMRVLSVVYQAKGLNKLSPDRICAILARSQ